MALKKLCSRTGCHKVVDVDKKYCSKHEHLDKERYKEYQRRRLQDELGRKYQEFYNSKEWRRLRPNIIASLLGMDILEYYTSGQISNGERLHHIVELEDDWSLRLDSLNLIYLTEKNHRIVHAAYERSTKDKKLMQDKLLKLLNRFYKEF